MITQFSWFLGLIVLVQGNSDGISNLLAKSMYQYEVHNVVTPDRYELIVHRILDTTNTTNPKVVFLNHGYVNTAMAWILRGPENALGYLLADSGYDVWMVNNRGNGISTNATGSAAANFWHFTLDDIAVNDTSVVIDYILSKTGQTQLTFVGHSQGCAIYTMLCLTKPEYEPKINKYIAMAPLFNMKIIPGNTTDIMNKIKSAKKVLGENYDMGNKIFRSEYMNCPSAFRKELYLKRHGYTPSEINNKLLKEILKYYPASGSAMNGYQIYQRAYKDDIAKYDYGPDNKAHYGTEFPPIYNLTDLGETPKYVFYGTRDNYIHQDSVKIGIKELKNVQRVFPIPYGHNDFLFGLSVKSNVNDEILKILTN